MQAELACGKEHQQRLARALEVPDQALAGLARDNALDDLVDAVDLLIAGDDLDALLALVRGVRREAGEQVEHHAGAEHRADRLLHLRHRWQCVLVFQPPRPPEVDRHADRAVAVLLAFGRDGEHVRHEQLGDVLLVVVVHLERPVEPALAGAHRRLGFDHDERDAVDQQHQVRPLLRLAGADDELLGDDELVLLDVVEVDEADGDVLAVLAERHRPLAQEPGGELLVGLDEAAVAHGHDDRPQAIEHIVHAVGLRGDRGVEADERLAQMVLDENLLRLTREVGGAEVVPAEAADLADSVARGQDQQRCGASRRRRVGRG